MLAEFLAARTRRPAPTVAFAEPGRDLRSVAERQ
jgi:hypothetical protein